MRINFVDFMNFITANASLLLALRVQPSVELQYEAGNLMAL